MYEETGLAGWRSSVDSPLLCPFSLLTGNFTGNFAKSEALGGPETVNNGVVTGFPVRIPYSSEQGIILAQQGILAREQGILSAGIGTITAVSNAHVRFTTESGHSGVVD